MRSNRLRPAGLVLTALLLLPLAGCSSNIDLSAPVATATVAQATRVAQAANNDMATRIAQVVATATAAVAMQTAQANNAVAMQTAVAQRQNDARAAALDRRVAGDGPSAAPRSQTLFLSGGDVSGARLNDPANGGGDGLVFRGLVSFNNQLRVTPELASSWRVSGGGKVYTFHLRPNATFHSGQRVTAADVIYSWERAVRPAQQSNLVLTYLGDIKGVAEMHAGKASHITGLKAIGPHTLRVTLTAPVPYFLGKLTAGVAVVLNRRNVESGANWYRKPDGTGPFKLLRWDAGKFEIYAANRHYYLGAPRIRYVVESLYAGLSLNLYESNQIDITGVSPYNAARVRNPGDPLHKELLQGVDLCTNFVTFDVRQAPFNDKLVRQAFALATDRAAFVNLVLHGVGIPARGLFPPSLPGYDAAYKGLAFDPARARRLLARSRYGGKHRMPTIVFTNADFGSYISPDIAALAAMWKKYLGVSIVVRNLEPTHYDDELHAGHTGQLISYAWCADYPDPENFAGTLYRTGAQQNLGHYSNPVLDRLLDRARVEQSPARRITMYQQAQKLIVNDAPSIFLNYDISLVLVKPYVKGFAFTPMNVSTERELWLAPH